MPPTAVKAGAEYVAPSVAAGKTGTTIVNVFVMVRTDGAAIATVFAVSFTATEKVYVPAVVGVPLSVPESGSSVVPGGRAPVDTEKA